MTACSTGAGTKSATTPSRDANPTRYTAFGRSSVAARATTAVTGRTVARAAVAARTAGAALFFGTGNQTGRVSSALIARVFLDPQLRLFAYDRALLLARAGEGSMRDSLSAFDQVRAFSGDTITIKTMVIGQLAADDFHFV